VPHAGAARQWRPPRSTGEFAVRGLVRTDEARLNRNTPVTTLVCPLCRIALTPPEHHCPRDGREGVAHVFEALPLALAARFRGVMPFAGSESASLYVADNLATGQRGLLKLYRHTRAQRDPELLRMRRELDRQLALTCPHLLVPWESGDTDGAPWLFRRWLDGVSLRVFLAWWAQRPASRLANRSSTRAAACSPRRTARCTAPTK